MSGHRKFSELRTTDPERRARIESGTQALREALRLAALREKKGMTQKDVARALSVSQAYVSKIEREEDVYLSTMRRYVEALGGEVRMIAVFDGEEVPVSLLGTKSGLGRSHQVHKMGTTGQATLTTSSR